MTTLLQTGRLLIRNWEERDRALFHLINSDEVVMEFFPFRRTRAEADAAMDEMRKSISHTGYGWTAVELRATGQCIGFVGLNVVGFEGVAPADSLQIGWRLAPEFWGKGYVNEAATALLDFAFKELEAEDVCSFAVTANHRSIAVMKRLSMNHITDFDHPKVPDTHPMLKRHSLYRITRSEWLKSQRMA